jgi:Tol biopolymer transport system component
MIVFTSLGDSGWDLYSMRMDGTLLTRLTTDTFDDLYPQWFDQHRRIAFETSRPGGWLHAMDPDGGNVTPLYSTPLNYDVSFRFAISRDGQRFAFTPGDANEVRVVNIAEPTSHRVAFGNQAAWSPDGRLIGFTTPDGIGIAKPGGTDIRILIPSVGASEPAWSPDGRWMAYSQFVAGSGDVIFVAKADGSGSRQLTSAAPGTFVFDRGAVWSPDGRYLAFQRQLQCPVDPPCWDIMVVPSAGGTPVDLTAPLFAHRVSVRPSW